MERNKVIRPSGLLKNNPNILNQIVSEAEEKAKELQEFNSNFKQFADDYSSLLTQTKGNKALKAYLVTFCDDPSLVFIGFSNSKDKPKWEAIKYFRTLYPGFKSDEETRSKYKNARRRRIPQFDKYALIGKVPLKELLQLGMSFSCAICGKGSFSLKDYKEGKCSIIEDGFEMNPFTKGIIVCPHCLHKKMK